MVTGHCLCGRIEFRVDGELAPIQVCYCKQCQRAQGTVLATNIPVNTDNFHFVQGEEHLRRYVSSPGKERCFCGHCGAPVFSRLQSLPNVVRVRAGLLDGSINTHIAAHFHVISKPEWWSIGDDHPQFETGQ
jgi:hypothetical protein